MGAVVVSGLLAFGVLALIGLVSARVSRPLWRSLPAAGPAFAVLGIGVAGWLQFVVTWLSPDLGRYFAFALVLAAVVLGVVFRVWRSVAEHPAILLIAAGVMLVYLGITYLWVTGDLDPFSLAALRYSFSTSPYPIDNALPFFVANKIQEGAGTHAFLMDWNGSDRPPLQSGTIITLQVILGGLGINGYLLPFAAGVALQLSWVPALWSLLRVLHVSRWISALALVFTAATATMLINTVYTWPKLVAAALVLVAFVLLIGVIQGRLALVVGLPAAALAFTLAMLSHGAAAFALPAVAVLAVAAMIRRSGWLRGGIVAAVVTAVTYLPWMAYQRFYDPPGDRLLKWHLAGVIPRDDRSFAQAVVEAYRSTSPAEFISSKLQNLGVVVDPFLHGSSLVNPSVVLDPAGADTALGVHRFNEYYSTAAALSTGLALVAVVLVSVAVLLVRRRPLPRAGLVKLMALMVPCILLWCLLMFIPGATVVHQGSHVWLVVLLAASFAWVASWRAWIGIPLVVVQAAVTAWYYLPFFGHSELRPAGLAVLVGGAMLVLLGLLVAWRQERAAERVQSADSADFRTYSVTPSS